MTREIEFRGKRCADGVWVYGDYVAGDSCDVSFIFPLDITSLFCVGGRYEVDENTVGQFTGLRDKNGKNVFEGDVVRMVWQDPMFHQWHERTVLVEFKYGRFTVYQSKPFEHSDRRYFEVIGNIYDNPELLNKR